MDRDRDFDETFSMSWTSSCDSMALQITNFQMLTMERNRAYAFWTTLVDILISQERHKSDYVGGSSWIQAWAIEMMEGMRVLYDDLSSV